MLRYCLPLFALAALLSLAARLPAAENNVREGKVVKAGEGRLIVTDVNGANKTSYVVKPGTEVTCDGKKCVLDDLKEGCMVKVTCKDDQEQTVLKIEAQAKGKDKN